MAQEREREDHQYPESRERDAPAGGRGGGPGARRGELATGAGGCACESNEGAAALEQHDKARRGAAAKPRRKDRCRYTRVAPAKMKEIGEVQRRDRHLKD